MQVRSSRRDQTFTMRSHHEERDQYDHHSGAHAGAAAAVNIGHPAADDTTRHHAERVKRRDHVRGRRVEVRRKNHRELEEHGVVDELEEAERQSVAKHVRDGEGLVGRERGGG